MNRLPTSAMLLPLGLLQLGLTWLGRRQDTPDGDLDFALVALAQGLVLALAAYLVLTRPVGPRLLALALVLALLPRLLLLAAPPFLSSDVYRYVWDGRVQEAGVNPYLYIPADPALESLRDDQVYPHINRKETAHTIYPPVAELAYAAIARVAPGLTGMRAAMLVLECGGVACLLAVLPRLGLQRARALIYAWHPLPLWEIASSGHVDALVIAALGLALLWGVAGRQGLAGAALAAAALVKFYPAVVAPAFWRIKSLRVPLAFLGTAVAAYACYAGAGMQVLGFLPGYAREEHLEGGSGFWAVELLQRTLGVPATIAPVYLALGACSLLWLSLRIARRNGAVGSPAVDARGALVLGGCAMLLLSPHYAWYFAWLLLLLPVAFSWGWLTMTLVAPSFYISNSSGHLFWQGLALYGGTALVLLVERLARRPATPSFVARS